MGLENFIEQWKEFGDISKAVGSMSDSRNDPRSFENFYNQFRAQVDGKLENYLFQEQDEFDEGTIEYILTNAGIYAQGLQTHVLNSTRDNLPSILGDIKTRLGDDNLVRYILAMGMRADKPKNFVDKLKDYKKVVMPLSEDNPQPGIIKDKLVSKINDVIGKNPDEKTKIIAEAVKGIYGNEKFAAQAYLHVFVRPKAEEIKNAINDGNEWIDYMRANLDEYTEEERIKFYSDMHARFRKD